MYASKSHHDLQVLGDLAAVLVEGYREVFAGILMPLVLLWSDSCSCAIYDIFFWIQSGIDTVDVVRGSLDEAVSREETDMTLVIITWGKFRVQPMSFNPKTVKLV